MLYYAKNIYFKVYNKIKFIYNKKLQPKPSDYAQKIIESKKVGQVMFELISDTSPRLLCRIGSVELETTKCYHNGKKYSWSLKNSLVNNAGFFPASDKNIDKFCELYVEAISNADLVGIWFNIFENVFLNKYAPNAKLTLLGDFSSPYFSQTPWSKALEGKKVLVIHPFEDSIIEQYKKREKLFDNLDVLPNFELKTFKAVQSIGGNTDEYKDWFEALEDMKNKIRDINFDIAIIGAGAYGLPLGAYIKGLGKTAIHLGGGTQILFGIKGKRWEDRDDFANIINDEWKRPYEHERPKTYKQVEKGCYW